MSVYRSIGPLVLYAICSILMKCQISFAFTPCLICAKLLEQAGKFAPVNLQSKAAYLIGAICSSQQTQIFLFNLAFLVG